MSSLGSSDSLKPSDECLAAVLGWLDKELTQLILMAEEEVICDALRLVSSSCNLCFRLDVD